MSIYRSRAGRQVLEQAYWDAVEHLDVEVEERVVETRHGSTHVLVAGPADGKPVVVFHGGNATNPMSLSWYTDLADEYRLIAPDIIGQPGKSAETRVDPQGDDYGEWVVDLLDAFELRSAPMMGTSYGGGVLLRAAAFAPERIERAALVVPAGFGTGSVVSLLRVSLPAVLYHVFPNEWLLERTLGELCSEKPNRVVRTTIAASLRHLKLENEFPEVDASELEAFDAPVALFVAEDDVFFPAATTIPRARELIPNLVYTETLPGESHMLSSTAQRRVTDTIHEFFGN